MILLTLPPHDCYDKFSITEADVLGALRQVIDLELGMNIVDLGLIYDVRIAGDEVGVAMTPTAAGCPMGESIRSEAEIALLNLEGVTNARVALFSSHRGIRR